jgi:hypothetical protein
MVDKKIFYNYLKKLTSVSKHGDAREESYYGTLSDMLTNLAAEIEKSGVHVTTIPKRTDAGNPDFRVWNGKNRIIGYIEAKPPSEENLDKIEKSKQLKRYLETFPNLILTNFLEFRLYRNGKIIERTMVVKQLDFKQRKSSSLMENLDELFNLLNRFMDFSLPKTFTAESLAIELAKRTRFLRDVVVREIGLDFAADGMLSRFYRAFQTYLIGTLTQEDFADLFAQTITYGLFAARIRASEEFTRQAAFDNIPHSIGVLRDLFQYISLGNMPVELTWCVDDIAEVLAVADVPGILSAYYRKGKGGDPIVHFYETFLSQYDPTEREQRGVYYTPEPVVNYIVRSLHEMLKTHFGKTDGLASKGVTLLDPAAGTMTFIAKAAQEAVDEFITKYGGGGREEFIRSHVLRNFYGFELMMAPYAVGHMKMGFFLEELGHRLNNDERMPFYLTNTLDNEELEQSKLPGLYALAEESRLAGIVKKETPVLVILGNPPYSGHSKNVGKWIRGLIEDYKQVDGKPLGEKNSKWLQDDYVKFLRFAQWKIEQAGQGLVGMITNHGFLDNPTFRGMRQSLMKTYDEIYLLNLHGNSRRKEKCPDGSPDKNVFEIKKGVAIVFFIKQTCKHNTNAVVQYSDLWGKREAKYYWLDEHTRSSTDWQELSPTTPYYLFVPQDMDLSTQYQAYISIPEIFPVNSVGIVTCRDAITIRWTSKDVWDTVTDFSRMHPELARQAFGLGKDSSTWKVTLAQEDLRKSGLERKNIKPILYRPFDTRYTYYTGKSCGFHGRPRSEVMRHLVENDNLALITNKQIAIDKINHTWITNNLTDLHVLETAHASAYIFPLYLYPKPVEANLFTELEPQIRQENLKSGLLAELAKNYDKKVAPEEILHYIYAVLYAPIYREKYDEFLSMEFPRVPFTADVELFDKLASLGVRLTAMHLLSSPELDTPNCQFEGKGDNCVERGSQGGLHYDPEQQRVYINDKQYFTTVVPEVWSYQVGGYQVCKKWLKERRDRNLELIEIQTYCRIVTALGKTIELQNEIDALYPQVEERVIDFSK